MIVEERHKAVRLASDKGISAGAGKVSCERAVDWVDRCPPLDDEMIELLREHNTPAVSTVRTLICSMASLGEGR